MREIVIKVPDNTCSGCKLIARRGSGYSYWKCPFRKYTLKGIFYMKPTQACRDAELNGREG